MRRLAPPLLAAALVAGLAASEAGGAEPSLEDARAERAEVQQRLDAAVERLDRLEQRVAEIEAEQAQLRDRLAELESTAAELEERLARRVRELYKRGAGSDPISVFISSDGPAEAMSRVTTVQQLVADDTVEAEEAAVVRTQVEAVSRRVAERQEELTVARARQRETTGQLRDDLERARELEQRLEREEQERRERERRARERRQAAAASAESTTSTPASTSVPSGGKACPVDQPRSYSDTWGASRSGGRSHQGTDILAPYGTPIRAIVSGTWDIYPYGASAGNWAILHGSDGNQYRYMHLQRHTVGDGASVSAGQQVATNGDTGNARGTPHLHFELHPGGGGAVNPYPLVRSVCG